MRRGGRDALTSFVPDPMHFDAAAHRYAEVRPPYPAVLWDDVRATGLVEQGRRALDLGAGTGEATAELLAHGMDVVAVEPGPAMVDLLRVRCPDATVVRARAEALRLRPGEFDLVVAATSIHWMDLAVVLPIVHRTLRRDGGLLVWRNVFGDPEAEVTPFRRAVEGIVQRRGGVGRASLESAAGTADRLRHGGLFSIAAVKSYRWTTTLTASQVGGLFSTFSDWSPAEVEAAAAAVSALGGTVLEHYTSWLIECRPA